MPSCYSTERAILDNGQGLSDIKYGPLRRITRRYREYANGEFLPSVPVKSLDFSPLFGR